MSKYAIKNVEGSQVAETELADSVFGIEPNISCIHQVVVCQDACKRQGTHSTKNRHDVSGGGAKPYRQKGTGRARQGSIRAGQWTGGGVIFGPTPHSHAKRVNHKMVKVAMRGVLSGKVADGEQTVGDLITEKTAKIGEKISVRRFVRYDGKDGIVDSYIHMGGKVGVLVLAEGEKNDTVAEVLHDVALQIAAASPVAPEYVTRDQVNPEHLHHETEILAAQARNEGKPEKIIEKMVQGRINKFYEEVCLLEQVFVKDGETRVGKMIENRVPGTKIVAFTRYKMGDGLEKKVNDLAAEVAEQIGKK